MVPIGILAPIIMQVDEGKEVGLVKRTIVHIEEDKCNGCGLCIDACHEGAIELVDGKARLVSDEYCDGLGDCLPECPTGAISLVEREAKPFDEELVQQKMAAGPGDCPGGCPGVAAMSLGGDDAPAPGSPREDAAEIAGQRSELSQWPIQLRLVNPGASYLRGAHLLVAADCAAYAHAGFHRDFIRGRITLIGCPKLDDADAQRAKLAAILAQNDIKSVTVVRMEVPCCGGIVGATRAAMLEAGVIVPYDEVIIGTDGEVLTA